MFLLKRTHVEGSWKMKKNHVYFIHMFWSNHGLCVIGRQESEPAFFFTFWNIWLPARPNIAKVGAPLSLDFFDLAPGEAALAADFFTDSRTPEIEFEDLAQREKRITNPVKEFLNQPSSIGGPWKGQVARGRLNLVEKNTPFRKKKFESHVEHWPSSMSWIPTHLRF